MNSKTIIPLFLLLLYPAFTSIAGAEEVVAGQQRPDFDDARILEKILAEALLCDTLEERGPEGAKLFYAPDSQTPYTGWCKRLYDNGKVKTLAHFREGKPDGPFTECYENGKRAKEGICKDGKMEGPATEWNENGQKKWEGSFKDGKLEGLSTEWHDKGRKTWKGSYKHGMLEGPFTNWDENKKRMEEGIYRNGKLEGLVTQWHENGEKAAEINYKDDKQEGPYTKWHENGQKAGEGTYKDGKQEGPYTRLDKNGKREEEGNYKEGKLEGLATQWDENGKVLRQDHFKNGQKIFENEPDLDDAETLKKTLGTALNWDVLKKDEQTGLYHNPDTRKPYTGWVRKLHGNGNVALLGALKDGRPAGLWTWWDENGLKEAERRQ